MKSKRAAAFVIISVYALSFISGSAAAEGEYDDVSYTKVTVYPEEKNGRISPYIYGINDKGDLSGAAVTVLKQTGYEISSYNWETNYSNSSREGVSSNGISLAESYPDSEWGTPALYTNLLINHSAVYGIPVKLATLQLMGYAAGDAMGTVSEGSTADRFAEMRFRKNDSYLNIPDISDNAVYIDEYAAYLVNKYGTAEEGGFSGFFLDSEPDLWDKNYPVLKMGETDADVLISRSAELSSSLKVIDGSALIFGPSVSGAGGCIDLGGGYDGEGAFMDHYLTEMRKAGEREKARLLDVLDVHYKAEQGSAVNGENLSEEQFRMQSVRGLWDSSYSDDTSAYEEYGEYMPLLTALNGSIERCYPNTKLSLSEYSFGGGSDMSGCIAEIDALGAFAANGVYLACLVPDEVWGFQKAAINLYNNYDYRGSKTGNISVRSKTGDLTSSSAASVDETDRSGLWVIITNKNIYNEKTFDIDIISDRSYELSEMYTVSGNNSRIVKRGSLPDTESGELELPPMSAALLVFRTDDEEVTENSEEVTDVTEISEDVSGGEITETTSADPVTETIDIITEAPEITEETEPDGSAGPPPFTVTAPAKISDSSISETVSEAEEADSSEPSRNTNRTDDREFPMPLKVTVIIVIAGCIGGIVYILIFQD